MIDIRSTLLLFFWCVLTNSTKPLVTTEVVHLKQRTEIYCPLASGCNISQWSFTPVDSTVWTVLFTAEIGLRPNVSHRISIKGTTAASVLVIQTTQPEDAGTYRCKTLCNVSSSNEIHNTSTELVVVYEGLVINPEQIEPTVEGGKISMQCRLRYRGNWELTVEWRQHAEDGAVVAQNIGKSFGTDWIVSCTLLLIANRTMDKARYYCRAYFSKYVGNLENAPERPNNIYTLTSPQLNVLYGPYDLKVSPDGTEYSVGEVLTCSAKANPEAKFKWNSTNNREDFNGPTMIVTTNTSTHLVCTAWNSISNSSISVKFSLRSKSESVLFYWLMAIIPSSILLLTLVLVIMCFLRYVKKASGESKANVTGVPLGTAAITTTGLNASESNSYTSINSIEITRKEEEITYAAISESQEMEDKPLRAYTQLRARDVPVPTVYTRLGQNALVPSGTVGTIHRSQHKADYANVDKEPLPSYYNTSDTGV